MSARYDAIVIGASVNGLAAAALLARAGARVLLLERESAPPEPFGLLHALDPVLVDALRLTQQGLAFRTRDLPLVGFADGAEPLTLARSAHGGGRPSEQIGDADAKAWSAFHREIFALGRRLRRWWWTPNPPGRPEDMLTKARTREAFLRLAYAGADAFLAARFDSGALRAALLFDAITGGFSPSEPGSALALVWRAAQEMAGLQGAVALPASGALVAALARAAVRADLRMAAPVAAIAEKRGAAAGVVLEDGAEIEARVVLSAVRARATACLLGDPPGPDAQVGEAQILFRLSQSPSLPLPFNTGRMIFADTATAYADAYELARAGIVPAELPLECVAGDRKLAVTARPLPVAPREGWAAQSPLLAARIVKHIDCRAPGLARTVTGVEFHLPRPQARSGLAQLLAPPAARLKTRLPNLLLCGCDAEPVPCVSGRAGRMAALLAAKALSS